MAEAAQRALEAARRTAQARLAEQARGRARQMARDSLEVAPGTHPFATVGVGASCPVPTGATTLLPGVAEAVDEERALADPYHRAEVTQYHLGMHSEDTDWQAEFVTALGPNEMAEAIASIDPTVSSPSGYEAARATELLGAATRGLGPAPLARMLEGIPPDTLAGIVEAALMTADNPHLLGTGQLDEQMAELAAGLGAIAEAFGPELPVLTALLDTLVDQPTLESWGGEAQSRVELAGWLVARSGSDTLRSALVGDLLPQLHPAADDAGAPARSLAMVMGSMEPPSVSLAPLVSADSDLRSAFVNRLLREGTDAVAAWPFGIGRDIRAGIVDFLGDVARLNPVLYPGHETDAALLRVQAFRSGVQVLNEPLWADDGSFERVLAHMLAADADTIVGRLSDGAEANALFVPEGHLLARFFDKVLFRPSDSGAAQIALGAVRRYLGVGSQNVGLADRLAGSQGNPVFMASEGNQLATRLGSVMGALFQGANGALESIDGQREWELALVRVFGALVEEAIDHSPVSKAYDAIKAGSDDRASVGAVAEWLYDTYGPGEEHRRDRTAVGELVDGLLNGSMRPFFSEAARQGARPEDWLNMLAMINVGAAQSDGESEPGFPLSP